MTTPYKFAPEQFVGIIGSLWMGRVAQLDRTSGKNFYRLQVGPNLFIWKEESCIEALALPLYKQR